jgi:hypothetical protein
MKRVQVSPGRYVTVSTEMAAKAARIFASGAFTAEQVRQAAVTEPQHAGNVLLGGSGKSRTAGRRVATAKACA